MCSFYLAELNSAIREKLEQFNANAFQKKEGSRRSVFLGEEIPLLATLPATRFELTLTEDAGFIIEKIKENNWFRYRTGGILIHNKKCFL